MTRRGSEILLVGAVIGALILAPLRPEARQQDAPPRILLDQPLRAVEYQLGRLSNEELVRVERKDSDARYRPVYAALLTRKGVSREVRDEALAALTKLDRTSAAQVLIDSLARLGTDEATTADKLLGMLFAQPADALRGQRELFTRTIDAPGPPFALRGAYGGLMVADGNSDATWQIALKHDGHLVELLRSVPQLPSDDAARPLRAQLFTPIAALLNESRDPTLRAAAIGALGSTRRDAGTFALLAQQIASPPAGSDATTRSAAISALLLIPESAWPSAGIEPLARTIVTLLRDAPADQRTEPDLVQAVQLGEKLAAALPEPSRLAIRRDLRGLGVRVVRVETRPEQMLFDLNWFAAEAGKPVQIVLHNPDAMPHNLVIIKPGALSEIGAAAAAMGMPSNPDDKPFVPDSPVVLQATRLVNEGETVQLSFTAPAQPGEYVYLCTFPGHWVRMYGVMLVVENLDAWEAKPTIPVDPVTKKPFASERK